MLIVVFILLCAFSFPSSLCAQSFLESYAPVWTPQNDQEKPVIVMGFLDENVSRKKEVKVFCDRERRMSYRERTNSLSYNEVEQKPVFQGPNNDFRDYLAKNLQYPVEAIKNGIEGTVVASFVVKDYGSIAFVRSPVMIDYLSDEVERVVKSWDWRHGKAWKPGNHNGKDVDVQCYFFVEFRLNGSAPAASTHIIETVYSVVEEMPLFDGKPAEKGFSEYVRKNLNYPSLQAQDGNGIAWPVIVEFIIDKGGSLINAKILRGVDPLLDIEALRVINSSPKWTPCKQDGKTVNVRIEWPVLFRN